MRWILIAIAFGASIALGGCDSKSLPTMVSGPDPSRMPGDAPFSRPVVVAPAPAIDPQKPVESERFASAADLQRSVDNLTRALNGSPMNGDGGSPNVAASISQLRVALDALIATIDRQFTQVLAEHRDEIEKLKNAVVDLRVKVATLEAQIAKGSRSPQLPNNLGKELAKLAADYAEFKGKTNEALNNLREKIDKRSNSPSPGAYQKCEPAGDPDCPVTFSQFNGYGEALDRKIKLIEDAIVDLRRRLDAGIPTASQTVCCFGEMLAGDGLRVRIGLSPNGSEIVVNKLVALIIIVLVVGLLFYIAIWRREELRVALQALAAGGAVIAVAATMFVAVSVVNVEAAPSPAPAIVFSALILVGFGTVTLAVIVVARKQAVVAFFQQSKGDIEKIQKWLKHLDSQLHESWQEREKRGDLDREFFSRRFFEISEIWSVAFEQAEEMLDAIKQDRARSDLIFAFGSGLEIAQFNAKIARLEDRADDIARQIALLRLR